MSNAKKRTYRYGTITVEHDADVPISQVQEAWASLYPDLTNAEAIEHDDNSVEFVVRAGTKG